MGTHIPEASCPSGRCGAIVSLDSRVTFRCWKCGFSCHVDQYGDVIPGTEYPPNFGPGLLECLFGWIKGLWMAFFSGSDSSIGCHVLKDVLSAGNPMNRITTPQPELTEVRGLPMPVSDADYKVANAIDYAAWDAGLCEICHKQQYSDDPTLECECIGGSRAFHRMVYHTERFLKRIETETKEASEA